MNKRLLTLCLSLALTATVGQARNEPEPSPESTKAFREGYNHVLSGDWAAASSTFGQLLEQHPDSSWADDAAFWICYAKGEQRVSTEEVFRCYENHLGRYRRSEWSDDAKRAMVRLAGELERAGKSQYRDRVRNFGQGDDDRQLLQVLVALGEIGDDRSVDVILERLDAASDEHLRARIVEVLEDIDSPRVAAKLEQLATSDPSEMVRIEAVEALGNNDSINTMPILSRIAKDTNQPRRVRMEAIDELGDFESADMLGLLKDLALDDDTEVANEAIDAIADMETGESLSVLIELLDTVPDPARRENLVHEIEHVETAEAANALLNVARNDPDPRIRRAATEALGDMDISAAREALIELLQTMEDDQ
ncbi:MAG: hypothetical protein DHS20C11_22290 [Lysobacteraceae bacterium]|nr:MAG: hypothetical protein DHS20C11_22290 [Xanthomonadaceae bacterium]